MNSKAHGRSVRRRSARALLTLAAGAALAASVAVGCAQDDCGDPGMHPDLSTSFGNDFHFVDMARSHDLAPGDGGSHD